MKPKRTPAGIGGRDPDSELATNSVPSIPVSKEQSAKSGWTSCAGHKFVIVGHKPKAYRTPAPRHPRCDIRTAWLFRDGAWSKVEGRISLEEVPNKTAKLEGKVVMSLTSFEKSREDPADTPDSDLEDPEPPAPPEGEGRDLRGEAKLREEATSGKHLFTHRPKNPFSPVCQRAKMPAPHARKKGGSGTITSKKFGDHVTMDHIISRELKDHGLDGERVALVIKDVYSKFRYIYPAEAKDTESCINSFKLFLKVIGTIYSDSAPELIAAARSLKARLVTSRAYVNENKSVIERQIKQGRVSKAHVLTLSRLVLV